MNNLKIVHCKEYIEIGRCVHCEARNICGLSSNSFKCKATIYQHYIDIKKERKLKLQKINEKYNIN